MKFESLAPSAAAVCVLLMGTALPVATSEERPRAGVAPLAGRDTLQRGEAYYHLMRATLAAHRGRVDEAILEVHEANKIRPDSAELQAESASLLVSLGQRVDVQRLGRSTLRLEMERLARNALQVEAEKLARRALRLDPLQPTALRLLAQMAAGRAMARAGDAESREEALRLYGILAQDPDVEDETLRILANLRFQAGDVEGAVRAARRLAEQREGDVQVVQRLAQMLQHDGRDAEALGVLLDFLDRYGEEDALVRQVSELARKTDQWVAVEAVCAQRLERHPRAVALRKLRGEALLQLNRYPQAVDELERALELDPQDPLLLFHLSTAYGGVGRLADAAATAQELTVALPDNPSAQAVLGETLARQRDLEAALEALGAALAAFSVGNSGGPEQRDRVRWRIAAIYMDQERFEAAQEVVDGLEQPDHPEALELQVRVALASGDPKGVRELLHRLRVHKKIGVAALLEGELLVREDRTSKAKGKFREAVSKLGPSVWGRIGEIWLRAERPEEGEKALRTWVRQEPQRARAHFVLGSFLERLGRLGEAEQELRLTLHLDATHADALNYLGYTLADRNERLDEALAFIQRALEIDPWNGAYLDSLGWVYYRMGRYREAREPLERAAREYPRDATVLEHLGDLYHQLGERDLALTLWRRALEAEPEDPDALRAKIHASQVRTDKRRQKIQPAGEGSGSPPSPRPPRDLYRH